MLFQQLSNATLVKPSSMVSLTNLSEGSGGGGGTVSGQPTELALLIAADKAGAVSPLARDCLHQRAQVHVGARTSGGWRSRLHTRIFWYISPTYAYFDRFSTFGKHTLKKISNILVVNVCPSLLS